jgi:hypothetical protein
MNKFSGFVCLATLLALSTGLARADVFLPVSSLDLGRPGEPAVAGSYAYDAGTGIHSVSGGGGDWWDSGEFGHFAYQPVSGDFWFQGSVSWVNSGPVADDWGTMNEWIKGGLAIRNSLNYGVGNEKEVNYFMAYLRPNRNMVAFQGRTTQTANMFNAESSGVPPQPAMVALNRWTDPEGDVLVQGFVDKGTGWQLVSSTWAWNLNDDAYLGLAVTSHNNSKVETAQFSGLQISAAVAPTTALPRKPGAPLNTPETLSPVVGGWSVVEVVGNGDMNNVGDAIRSLEDGGGTRHSYTRMGAININEGGSNAKYFSGDTNYAVATDGVVVGEVNHLAMVARGQIHVPESDWWSFYINSDDGEELSIGNRQLVLGTEGWNDNNIGSVWLEAGVHNIQVIHREATGGANVEVAAARGQTTNLAAFNLIGAGAAARDAYQIPMPGVLNTGAGSLVVEQTLPGFQNVGNLSEARQAIVNAKGEENTPNLLRLLNEQNINYRDPEDGSDGSFGSPRPWPINTSVNDDNFATMVSGVIDIVMAGDYFFGFQSDDGASLKISGATWLEIVESAEAGRSQISGETILFDGGTGNSRTIGKVSLAVGQYPFEFLTWDGGGGSYAELFGGGQQGQYELLSVGGARIIDVPAAVASLNLVPEPSTWAMIISIGLAGLFASIRRRR